MIPNPELGPIVVYSQQELRVTSFELVIVRHATTKIAQDFVKWTSRLLINGESCSFHGLALPNDRIVSKCLERTLE